MSFIIPRWGLGLSAVAGDEEGAAEEGDLAAMSIPVDGAFSSDRAAGAGTPASVAVAVDMRGIEGGGGGMGGVRGPDIMRGGSALLLVLLLVSAAGASCVLTAFASGAAASALHSPESVAEAAVVEEVVASVFALFFGSERNG